MKRLMAMNIWIAVGLMLLLFCQRAAAQPAKVDSLERVYQSKGKIEERAEAAKGIAMFYEDKDSAQALLWATRGTDLLKPQGASPALMKCLAAKYRIQQRLQVENRLATADTLIESIPHAIDSITIGTISLFAELLEQDGYHYTSRRLARTALKRLSPKTPTKFKTGLLLVESFAENELQNHSRALELARQSLQDARQSKDVFHEGYSLDLIATYLKLLNRQKESLEYRRQAIQVAERLNETNNKLISLYYIVSERFDLIEGANDRANRDSLLTAVRDFNDFFNYTKKKKPELPFVFDCLHMQVNSYIDRLHGKFDQVFAAYDRIIDQGKKNNQIGSISLLIYNLAEMRNEQGQHQKAIQYLNELLVFDRQGNLSLDLKLSAHESLHRNYARLGQHEAAYRHLLNFHKLRDSLNLAQERRQAMELAVEFEAQQKDHQLALQTEQLKAQEATIARRGWQAATIGGGLLLSLLLAGVLLRASRRQRRDNDALRQQNEQILQQREEIRQQTEEISQQRDALQSANNRLLELDRFKDGMVGMIVHDLKNPLNAVLALSALQPADPAQQTIRKAGQRMLYMVQNLLDVQKYESAEVKLNAEALPIIDLAAQAVEETRLLLDEKGQSVVLDLAPEIGVVADRELMVRVLVNLLTNASKYAPYGDAIEISARADGQGRVRVEVSDHGQGIPPDKLETVFDRFSQVVARKSGQAASTGLGLTFCKLVVEAHGGQIAVASEPGRLTTFHFTLSEGYATRAESGTAPAQPQETRLSDEERTDLKPLLDRLASMKVYELSAILDTLDEVRAQRPALDRWCDRVEQTALMADEGAYQKLLAQ